MVRPILSSIMTSLLVAGLSCIMIVNFGTDSPQNYLAFAQTNNGTYDGPIPEDNTTADNNPLDSGNGPIPEDNSTYTYPGNQTSSQNGTFGSQGPTVPDVSSDLGNTVNLTSANGTSQGNGTISNPVPEFGSLAPLVLVISVLSIIILNHKTKLLK